MRAAAVLFLPALAALALVGALELTTGGAKPVEPQSFVWKKRIFTSKREFTVWLKRRNVRYADWAARHPGASPPWKKERGGSGSGDDDGLGALPLLAAALAAIAVLFVFTRASASRLARGARRSLLARLRAEETLRPLVMASGAAALRHAVSVYGLRPAHGDEPPQKPAPPELVLVEAPPPLVVESRAVVDPKPDPVAIELPQRAAAVAESEPAPVVEAPPRRRRRPMRAAEQIPVDTTPRMDAAAAEEPARREPEPEPGASTPEPDPVAAAAPPKRRPARRQARKAAVERAPRKESASPKEPEPVRLQPEPAPEPEPAALISEPEPEPEPVVSGAAPRHRGRRSRRGQEPQVQITQSAEPARVEDTVTPESIVRPAASAGASEPESKPIDQLPLPAPAPEPPSPEPVPAPLAPHSVETQATEPPFLPVRDVVCEVAFWRGYLKGQFYARIWGDDGMSAVATSPMFRCRSAPPEQTDECLEALAALHELLVAEGWEPNGQGRAWYARRFTNQVPA